MADSLHYDSKLIKDLLPAGNHKDEQKEIDTRYPHCTSYSGVSLCACLYAFNVICFMLVFFISRFNYTNGSYGCHKKKLLVTYFRKLSLMQVLTGGVATATAFWLSKIVAVHEDVGTASFNVFDLNYLVIFTIFLTIAICIMRYMSFGIANSDTYNLQSVSQKKTGKKSKTALPQNDGFFKDKNTQAFVVSLQTYVGYAVIIGVLVSVFLFCFSPSENKEPFIDIELCIPNELMQKKNRVWLTAILTLAMNICCFASESLLEIKRKDILGASVTSAYFTTTVFSTNCGWLVVLGIMYFIMDCYPMQFMIMWEIFSLLDAGWIMIFSFTTLASNKAFNI